MRGWSILIVALAGACSLDAETPGPAARGDVAVADDAPPVDATSRDAAPADGGGPDVRAADVSVPDVGADGFLPDTRVPDVHAADSTLPDARPADAMAQDGAPADAALPDAAMPEPACRDPAEPPGGDDTPRSARVVPAAPGDHQEVGRLCAGPPPDEDWLRVEVPPGARLCAAVQPAELSLEAWAPGPPCAAPADCGEAETCVDGTCLRPIGRAAEPILAGTLDLGRDHANVLLRVAHGEADLPVNYQIDLGRTPAMPCAEVVPGLLGAVPMAACGRICADAGHWLDLMVRPGQHLTVLVHSASRPLVLSVQGTPSDPSDMFSGYRTSAEPGAWQCINLRGGLAPGRVQLAVEQDVPPQADSADYLLRVVPTDLDRHPAGACAALSAPDLGSCARDEVFSERCWPLMPLP